MSNKLCPTCNSTEKLISKKKGGYCWLCEKCDRWDNIPIELQNKLQEYKKWF